MGYWTEYKYKPRTWRFRYTYTTRKGRKGIYKVQATQNAIKTSNNTYRLIMRGKRQRIRTYKRY